MKKSMKLIRDLTRGLATDKCILTLLFIVVGRCTLIPPDPQLKGAWYQVVSTLALMK
jgi:hypothetical protein